jgi:hypothetical protein
MSRPVRTLTAVPSETAGSSTCRSAAPSGASKEKNLLSFPSRDEALAQHYEPARDCKP